MKSQCKTALSEIRNLLKDIDQKITHLIEMKRIDRLSPAKRRNDLLYENDK